MRRSALLFTSPGILVGVVGMGLVRFAALPPSEHVHYHANWAIWLDGERVDLSADRYMEDVASRMASGVEITAKARVHMHENNPDLVHVHHEGVTWGHLLQNLDWAAGPDRLLTDKGEIYRDGGDSRLVYIVNGFAVPPVYDRIIRPGDRLLIYAGKESVEEVMASRFPTVATDAATYDATFDPAGCMGHATETLGGRLRSAFWF